MEAFSRFSNAKCHVSRTKFRHAHISHFNRSMNVFFIVAFVIQMHLNLHSNAVRASQYAKQNC